MTNLLIVFWTVFWCSHYGVDPTLPLAVAHIESRSPGREFRIGLLAGKWYGPYNIHKDFKKRWPDIAAIEGNCRAGVRGLRGQDKMKVLKRYNPEATQAYLAAVMKAKNRYRRILK